MKKDYTALCCRITWFSGSDVIITSGESEEMNVSGSGKDPWNNLKKKSPIDRLNDLLN